MNTEPTQHDLESPEFKAVWEAIKNWDLDRGDTEGRTNYAGATGTDVMAILNAINHCRTVDFQEKPKEVMCDYDGNTTKNSDGVGLIAKERQKQIDKYGFTGEHHANHPEWYDNGQLISAAHMISSYDAEDDLSYLFRDIVPLNWNKEWWHKMCDKPAIDRIIIAGSFHAAELDRLQNIKS